MTELIACLSSGKGTWAEVAHIMQAESWDAVYLVSDEFGREKFQGKAEFVLINDNMPITMMSRIIREQLQNRIKGTEVAVNFSSGSGKEHMAMLSAVLQLGVGLRFVAMTERGIVTL
ncbi:MAG: hypothetical protein V1735_02880 [Nanoarchaeota archaeon]